MTRAGRRRDLVLRLVVNYAEMLHQALKLWFRSYGSLDRRGIRNGLHGFRYKRYQIDGARHRGDTERTYGGEVP